MIPDREVARAGGTGHVDLRGREDESDVLELLNEAHGSRASVGRALRRYRDGEWRLIGWQEQGRVVACAGVSRDSDRTVVLHSVSVARGSRGRGIGRALLGFIADHAGGPRLLAETDEAAVEFYRRCGFEVELLSRPGGGQRFRCVRTIVLQPGAPRAVHAWTLTELERVIRRSWSIETSDDPEHWTSANPARGQCVGTALLVRELLGGEILLANVILNDEWVERHAWNRLPTGVTVDLTRSQFTRGEELTEPVVGEPVATHRSRYDALAARVRERLERLA